MTAPDAMGQAHDALMALREEANALRDRAVVGWTGALAEGVYAYVRVAGLAAGQVPARDRAAALHAAELGEVLAKAGRFVVRYIDAMEAPPVPGRVVPPYIRHRCSFCGVAVFRSASGLWFHAVPAEHHITPEVAL